MIAVLRSLVYAVVFYLGSVPFVVAAALFHRLDPGMAIPTAWARFHYRCVRLLLGIRVRVEGTLPQQGPVLLAWKHESMLETSEILRLVHSPAVVFKAELLDIPVWGQAALGYGVIALEREAGPPSMRKLLREAKAASERGRPIIIFPEGTRVAPGERPPLRAGVAGLYRALGVPVVPVALDSGRLWRRRRFVKHSGVVTIRVMPAIPPGLPRDEAEAAIHAGINALNSSASAAP